MKDLWIGVVEVLTDATEHGDTRAFTNVVTWAASVSGYVKAVTEVLSEHGWVLLGSENVRPVDLNDHHSDEIAEIIERARTTPNACILATLHYYSSRPA